MEIEVLNFKGESIRKIDLDSSIFEVPFNNALMHEVITAYRASIRGGNASTKTRKDVSGGGKKPWRQKGTGRARAGSSRSPLWRKGGVIFGPHPRSYAMPIPKKKIRAAICQALSDKVQSSEFKVVDFSDMFKNAGQIKTKKVIKMLESLKSSDKKVLLVVDKMDPNFVRASRNIRSLSLVESGRLHAYSVMEADNVFFTEEAVNRIKERMAS